MHKKLELPRAAYEDEDQEAKAPFPRFVMPKVLIRRRVTAGRGEAERKDGAAQG
jgi:hypothetical protein